MQVNNGFTISVCARTVQFLQSRGETAACLTIVMGTSFFARSLMVADDAAWRDDLDKNLDKKQTGNLACWAIAIVVLLLQNQNLRQTASQALPVPYSEFEKAFHDGRVADITVTDRALIGRLNSLPQSADHSCRPSIPVIVVSCARGSRVPA